MYAWKVTDLLKEVKTNEQVRLDVMVGPEHIPRRALHATHHPPAQLFGHLFNHIIVCDCVRRKVRERLMQMRELGGGHCGVGSNIGLGLTFGYGPSRSSKSLSTEDDY